MYSVAKLVCLLTFTCIIHGKRLNVNIIMKRKSLLEGLQDKENYNCEAYSPESTTDAHFLPDEAEEYKPANEDLKTPMQVLEHALELCKFGWFHYKLMFASFMSVFSYTSVVTTSSYMLSSTECELQLTIIEKGFLNAMPFFGQVGGGLFSGFITDAFGRKKFLIGGHAGLLICALIEGSSQTYWMLVVGKLFDGIFLSLAFSATAVMVSEFTHKGIRDGVLLVYSAFMSLSLILCALVAWGFLIRPWHFVFLDGQFELHSWNIYLYSTSIIILVPMLMYIYLPESPKFLLSLGKESEALAIIKIIYQQNSGEPKESFPITSFNPTGVHFTPEKKSIKTQLRNALSQSKELFQPPLVFKLLLFGVSGFVCLLAYSSLRLWFPQLSTIIENYQHGNGGKTARFCVMITGYTNLITKNVSLPNSNAVIPICVPHFAGAETYINGIILGSLSLFLISSSSILIYYIGQKPLIFFALVACAMCSTGLYWTSSALSIAILLSGACALMQCSLSLQNNMLVRVMPTTVRTLALTICIMLGRTGSLVGSIIFPLMLEKHCMLPFLTLTGVTLSMAALIYFFPNPIEENMETGDN